MHKDTSLLASVHGVGNVGAAIAVGITHSKDTSFAGAHTSSDIDLVVDEIETHLGRKSRSLNSWDIDHDGVTLNWLTGSEVNQELVELSVGVLLAVLAAILQTLNGGDGAVVDGGVPPSELLLPIRDLGGGASLALRGLSSVDECDDIVILSVSLEHVGQLVGDITDQTEGLVTVLVTIAPGAPEDTLAPSVLEARSRGKNILNTGSQHDLAGGVVLALAISDGERRVVTCGPWNNGLYSLIGEVGCRVLGDLLPRQTSEDSGRST